MKKVVNIVIILMLAALGQRAYAQNYGNAIRSAAQTVRAAAARERFESDEHSSRNAGERSRNELDLLRAEVRQLRAEIGRLRGLVERGDKHSEPAALPPSVATSNESTTRQDKPARAAAPADTARGNQKGSPQSTAQAENPHAAVTSKAQGGDLAGAGNLLRTDRITIGGYGDFQFRQSSISERADGGGTPTFQNTRFVLGVAAVLAEKQNIVFNSEIEYEFGSREIDIEQAYVEWKLRAQIALRGGIIVPAIGRFNTYHDSYLNLTTIRPLINQFIVPTAYRDAGVGVRGRFKLPYQMKLTYEADIVNGMLSRNADGEPTPFSRLLGQSSAAEPGLVAFQAPRRRKAIVARVGLSPVNGLEFGSSVYNGRFTSLVEIPRSATILFFDGSYHRGALAINGEYGRSNIVGGIPRRSPAPPAIDPSNPESITALAEFVAQLSPGQDGFYLEGTYRFSPRGLTERFDEGGYIAPVVRYEIVRLDRTIPNFYLNRSRTTVGLNVAPSSTVIFKMNYLFDHTFGPAPDVPAGVGGALFGESPLPHLRYGRNGFTASAAYVF